MGWDAYATKNGKELERLWHFGEDIDPELKDPILSTAFGKAADKVNELGGGVDWLLRLGGLDVSTCGYEMQRCLGEPVWTETPWSADKLLELYEHADWSEPSNEEALWAYNSAKAFVETCVKHNLGVRFSF